jgi:hypothetical protein
MHMELTRYHVSWCSASHAPTVDNRCCHDHEDVPDHEKSQLFGVSVGSVGNAAEIVSSTSNGSPSAQIGSFSEEFDVGPEVASAGRPWIIAIELHLF